MRSGVYDSIAFSAACLPAVEAGFAVAHDKYYRRRQKESVTWQLFCFDPNGAKGELDFDSSEIL